MKEPSLAIKYETEKAMRERLEQRCTRIESSAAAMPPLLRDAMARHRDPDNSEYNECEKPGFACQWCEAAAKAIADYEEARS